MATTSKKVDLSRMWGKVLGTDAFSMNPIGLKGKLMRLGGLSSLKADIFIAIQSRVRVDDPVDRLPCPGIRQISDDTGSDRRNVVRALKSMEEDDRIVKILHGKAGYASSESTNHYDFTPLFEVMEKNSGKTFEEAQEAVEVPFVEPVVKVQAPVVTPKASNELSAERLEAIMATLNKQLEERTKANV